MIMLALVQIVVKIKEIITKIHLNIVFPQFKEGRKKLSTFLTTVVMANNRHEIHTF